jgi:GNAT superfamily N-acetyltransferase
VPVLEATAKAAAAKKSGRKVANSPADASAVPPAADEAPHWHDTLRDGTHVLIRPISKTDTELERAFIMFLPPDVRRTRFLGQAGEPSDELLRCLTDIDYRHDMAFVALVHHNGETREVGVSRYGLGLDGKTCECAVNVSDAWRHRGLAAVLMRHLIDYARAGGIRTMVSFDAAANDEMRELAAFLGFERKKDPRDASRVIHSLAL